MTILLILLFLFFICPLGLNMCKTHILHQLKATTVNRGFPFSFFLNKKTHEKQSKKTNRLNVYPRLCHPGQKAMLLFTESGTGIIFDKRISKISVFLFIY